MLVSVGLNQRCAPVAERELLAVDPASIEAAIAAFSALDGIDEVAVLSTCYRVEVFAATPCPAAAAAILRRALAARAGREIPLLEARGEEALRHLVRVASSLESPILGEPQILGQVKDAFQRALDSGTAGSELAGVLERTLRIARRVRTETAIGRPRISWGHAAAALAEKVLGPLSGRRAAVVGAGSMARAAARHLRDAGASVSVLNRTLANAEALAREVDGEARPLEALLDELLRADLVVSAAPAALAQLGPGAMGAIARLRRGRLVLVDLAVPRSIPPETGDVPDVYLCDVDDLERATRAGPEGRQAAVERAEKIVDEEMAAWAHARAARRAAPLIREMRERAGAIARDEVERTLRRLGEDPELARRLDLMAGSIVSKLLHRPTARLREAASGEGGGEALFAAAIEIFELGTGPSTRRENAA